MNLTLIEKIGLILIVVLFAGYALTIKISELVLQVSSAIK